MIRGARILLVSGSLAAAGCAASHDLRVRAIADPAAKFRYGGDLVGQARAQLALGNAGLALETFRKLQREQPASADAFAGIAACYAAMGRYDLERANYEFALAYAPSDPALLNALASSLARLGEGEQAAQVRSEAARMSSVSAVHAPSEQAAVAPLSVPRLASVTVKLPAATAVAAPTKQAADTPIAAPQLSAVPVHLPPVRPAALKTSNLYVEIPIRAPKETSEPAIAAVPKRQPFPPADRVPDAVAVQVELRTEQGPYMQRLSSGEVSLITSLPPHSQPRQATRAVRIESTATAAPVQPPPRQIATSALRWVPLRFASAPSNIRLLNAARSEGLAARTRAALLDGGWRKIRIGNARQVRQRSVVLYSPMRAVIGRRLAARFRCKAVRVEGIDQVIVLLGRDAALPRTAPSRA